jgi:hypothetical protein
MADKPTVTVGPWPQGIDNRSPDYAVPADALRNAVDVDLGRDGRVQRRKGFTRVVDIAGAHSLFSCPAGTFFAAQGTLYRLNIDNSTTPLLSGLIGSRVAYEYFNGVVYLSDGSTCHRIVSGVTPYAWGLPRPQTAPVLHILNGNMVPGTFSAAISYIDVFGEESSLSPLAQVTTSAPCSLVLTDFPTVTNSDVAAIRLYLSGSGSTTLYHVADIDLATDSYAVQDRSDTGKTADTRVYMATPPASIIRQHNGRMYLVVDSNVYYTEPYALSKVDPVASFWSFAAPVSIMEPVSSGVFVVADKTYFLRFTDPADAKLEIVLNYGAVPHTSIRLPHNEGVMWQSVRGTIMGNDNGSVNNIQEERVAADTASTGAAFLREQDGVRQFVASMPNPNVSPLAAKSFMEAEIIRRGS